MQRLMALKRLALGPDAGRDGGRRARARRASGRRPAAYGVV